MGIDALLYASLVTVSGYEVNSSSMVSSPL